MKNQNIGICFQCDQKDIIIENENVCPNCDRMNRENDYKNGEIDITKDNIHLYYEFMSDEDKNSYVDILDVLLYARLKEIGLEKLEINNVHKHIEKVYYKDTAMFISYSLFGIKDTLKPIDEYIADIKESSEYKEYLNEH